jgi:hypothetical protein
MCSVHTHQCCDDFATVGHVPSLISLHNLSVRLDRARQHPAFWSGRERRLLTDVASGCDRRKFRFMVDCQILRNGRYGTPYSWHGGSVVIDVVRPGCRSAFLGDGRACLRCLRRDVALSVVGGRTPCVSWLAQQQVDVSECQHSISRYTALSLLGERPCVLIPLESKRWT